MAGRTDRTAAPPIAVVRDQVGVPPCLVVAEGGRTILVPMDRRRALRLATDLLRLAGRLEGFELVRKFNPQDVAVGFLAGWTTMAVCGLVADTLLGMGATP